MKLSHKLGEFKLIAILARLELFTIVRALLQYAETEKDIIACDIANDLVTAIKLTKFKSSEDDISVHTLEMWEDRICKATEIASSTGKNAPK